MHTICGNMSNIYSATIADVKPTTTTMEEKIKEILNDYQDREARASLAFFLCFNLLEDSKFTSGELRKIVYDALDMLGVEE